MSDEEILYHYTTSDSFLKILESQSLRLSSLDAANDHKEGTWILEKLKNFYGGFDDFPSDAVCKMLDSYRNDSVALAFCFSKRSDLLSQWRGYADDGRGVAIGFRRSVIEEEVTANLEGKAGVIQDLTYDDEEHDEIVDETFEALTEVISSFRDADKDDDIDLSRLVKLSYRIVGEMYRCKNPAFVEEQEARLLTLLLMPSNDSEAMYQPEIWKERVRLGCREGTLFPYMDWKFENFQRALDQVLIGPKNNTSPKQLSIWLKLQGFPDVTVLTSDASYR